MKPKKITAGGVTLIATLLSSLPESSASPDINPWIGKAANWEREDCQGLRPPTAGSDSIPTARLAPEIQRQRQQNNGRVSSCCQSSLGNGWDGELVTWMCSLDISALPYCRKCLNWVFLLEQIPTDSPPWAVSRGDSISLLRTNQMGRKIKGAPGRAQKRQLLHLLVARHTDHSP